MAICYSRRKPTRARPANGDILHKAAFIPSLTPQLLNCAVERDTETRQPPGLPGLAVAASDSLLSTPLNYKSTVYLGMGRGWRSKEIILAG